ncbi:hypothetical protein PG993_006309 [Apiospora rasikravindrae]|uniref:Uncharacterized protein n=1 Tax=Apiospora rasikravindrae TaxID=990691 RepID=A0ABR1T5D2_9PEZI
MTDVSDHGKSVTERNKKNESDKYGDDAAEEAMSTLRCEESDLGYRLYNEYIYADSDRNAFTANRPLALAAYDDFVCAARHPIVPGKEKGKEELDKEDVQASQATVSMEKDPNFPNHVDTDRTST